MYYLCLHHMVIKRIEAQRLTYALLRHQRREGDLWSLRTLSDVVDGAELQPVGGVGPQTPELETHVRLLRLHAELHLLTVVRLLRLLVADDGSGDGVTLGHRPSDDD